LSKRIFLQVDGGGILGITPAIVLMNLEKKIQENRKDSNFLIRDILTLCCGTSTGAIIAGCVAAGISAESISKFYSVDGLALFRDSKNPFITRLLQPKFNRQPFLEKLDEMLSKVSPDRNSRVSLGELPASLILMTTAYNLSSHRTHFIKSDETQDKQIQLRDAIAWSSLSAAYYFGKINVPNYTWTILDNSTPPKPSQEKGAVFQDGGQGTQNCTLDFVLTEILARKWDDDEVIIISLGTGIQTKFEPYEKTTKISDICQALKYLANQARDESTTIQEMAARYVQHKRPNIKLFRLDYEAAKDYSLDDVDHADDYKNAAKDIVQSDEFNQLCKLIC